MLVVRCKWVYGPHLNMSFRASLLRQLGQASMSKLRMLGVDNKINDQ